MHVLERRLQPPLNQIQNSILYPKYNFAVSISSAFGRAIERRPLREEIVRSSKKAIDESYSPRYSKENSDDTGRKSYRWGAKTQLDLSHRSLRDPHQDCRRSHESSRKGTQAPDFTTGRACIDVRSYSSHCAWSATEPPGTAKCGQPMQPTSVRSQWPDAASAGTTHPKQSKRTKDRSDEILQIWR